MDSSARPGTDAARPRAAGTELWFLRAGTPAQLEAWLEAFARLTPLRVLVTPEGREPLELAWAAALAARCGVVPEHLESSAAPAATPEERGARLWACGARLLSSPGARLLFVLPHDVLRGAVAAALGLSPVPAPRLRIAAGRGVQLRVEPKGIVLRRLNVLSPQDDTGTALPGGHAVRPC